jgi:hypothetical protein
MVADSILQQSKYDEVCDQGPMEMANFLGLEESTVRKAKKSCQEKGVIQSMRGGFIPTDAFFEAVRFASGTGKNPASNTETGKNPAQTGKNPKHTLYINKEIISEQSSQKESSQIEDDVTFEVDEDFAPARSLRSRKPAPSTPLVSWAEQRRGRKFTTPIKQRSAILKLKESLDDEDIKALWMETENDEYWKERGLDFTILLSIADKKLTMGNRKDAEKDFKYHMSIIGKMMYDRKPRDEILAYREKHITPLKEKYGFK